MEHRSITTLGLDFQLNFKQSMTTFNFKLTSRIEAHHQKKKKKLKGSMVKERQQHTKTKKSCKLTTIDHNQNLTQIFS